MSDIDENDGMSEIDRILKRHEENSRYSNGLIRSESVRETPITEEEIRRSRQISREFLKELNL
jgi:hypothetical protein